MSDTGDSGTSDVGDSQESSVFSDWSVVDEHGDLPDDDTTSNTSSVEIVEEDGPDDGQPTPVAGSPNNVAPKFILRLPSHEQASDTDEDQTEDSSSARSQLTEMTPSSAGAAYRQSSASARISQDELDELRQTLDTLKRNLKPTQADDCSVSSMEMFGKGDKMNQRTETDLQPQSLGSQENIGDHGNVLDGDLSLESSVSSSYSFLSRDTGTECSFLREMSDSTNRATNDDDTPPLIKDQGNSNSDDQIDTETEQPESAVVVQKAPKRVSASGWGQFPLEYMLLLALSIYTGFVIFAVLHVHGLGSGPELPLKGEDIMLDRCLKNTQDLQTKMDIYRNAYHDSDTINRKKCTDSMETMVAERDELASKFEKKVREILALQHQVNAFLEEREGDKTAEIKVEEMREELVNVKTDNVRLNEELDAANSFCNQKIEELKADSQTVQQQCMQAKDGEKKRAENDFDSMRGQYKVNLDRIKSQCQVDMDQMKTQCHADLDKLNSKCQTDLDSVKSQCQLDQDKIRYQCQSDIDDLRNRAERDENMRQAKGERAAKTKDEKVTPKARSKAGKEPVGDQAKSRQNTGKEKEQSSFRKERSSGKSERKEGKSDDKQRQFNKEGNSDEHSKKGDHSRFNWADIVMDLMNKTSKQLQDTWTKVKNVSENLWQEHQPSFQRMQESFIRKVQHIGKKFHGRVSRKMNRWLRKFQKYAYKDSSDNTANTKRRQYTDDVTNSNRTVEKRLLKLSHQVEALNAKKFKKWRQFPKVLDIQREFEQVNILINAGKDGNNQQSEKNKMPVEYSNWFDCQFRWWRNLETVAVADDCYMSLCCWQVKVTGGNAKQCRKTKRKQGLVEDLCALRMIPKPPSPKRDQTRNAQYPKTRSENKAPPTQNNEDAQGKKDDATSQESGDDEDNWFLAMGEERAYHREEPDDWFFRHNDKNAPEGEQEQDNWFLAMGEDREFHREEPDDWFFKRTHKTEAKQRKARYTNWEEDYDDDDDAEDDETRYCDYDIHTGDCIDF